MGSTRRPVIAGNWKMYKTVPEARAFVEALALKVQSLSGEHADVVIAPPAIALQTVREAVERLNLNLKVAAQTMESRDEGAFTGEISPVMLADLRIPMVILGHSERRQYYNETDVSVAAKMSAAFAHNLTPIVCVGELLAAREAGETDAVIEAQLKPLLAKLSADQFERLVVAYEPVWAIGTGKTCDAEEANRVCGVIRKHLGAKGNAAATRILYGGSVKPDNIQGLMGQPEIDGALVGGASLEVDSFFKIIEGSLLATAH
ncbi:MAG: triose-phosphate isomerase [Candidatus Melainabacteria bacterium]